MGEAFSLGFGGGVRGGGVEFFEANGACGNDDRVAPEAD